MLRIAAPLAVLLLGLAPMSAGAATAVEVLSVKETALPKRVTLSGQLNAAQHAALSPRLAGVVEALAVDAGARVATGDRLLKLDDRLARLSLQSAEAAVRGAAARLADAERVERDTAPLAAQGLLPASQLESVRAQLEVARAALRESEADAAVQREQLDRHWLVAPFEGVVVERQADVGEWVQASDAVMTLVSDAALRFDARAPQEWYGRIDPAAPITLRIDGRETRVEGVAVEAQVPATDPESRSFLLRLTVPPSTPALLPGASGRVELGLLGSTRSFAVPREAVVRYPDGGHGLWLAVDDGGSPVARARRVVLDPALNDPARVIEGLDGGERVVVRGLTRLRDGEPLQIAAER